MMMRIMIMVKAIMITRHEYKCVIVWQRQPANGAENV
jgi:hypothetical protein